MEMVWARRGMVHAIQLQPHRTGWFNGDFDGNGVIDFDDYSLIDLAFNTQGQVLSSPSRKPGRSA